MHLSATIETNGIINDDVQQIKRCIKNFISVEQLSGKTENKIRLTIKIKYMDDSLLKQVDTSIS